MSSIIQKRNEFIKLLSLSDQGFSKVNININNLNFYRDSTFKIDILTIVISDFTEFRYTGIYPAIHFKEVENFLQPIINKYDPHPAFVYSTVRLDDKGITDAMEKSNLLRGKILEDLDDVNHCASLLREELIHFIEPYWNKFTCLENVNESVINALPRQEYSSMIAGSYTSERVLLIMKLCNNEKFDEYLNWFKTTLNNVYEKDPKKWEKRYNIFQELEPILLS